MVNKPLHDVEAVVTAALNGKVHFSGRNAERRATEEGFTHEDVCRCTSEISNETYRTTIPYPDSRIPFDVHLCLFQGQTVYLKLKLTTTGSVVVLASFHKSEYST